MSRTMTVSAAEANRSFSKLMRAVEEGVEVTVTSHGKPKMKMVPISDGDSERKQRLQAFHDMQKRWAKTEPKVIGPWTRDDLYDRDW